MQDLEIDKDMHPLKPGFLLTISKEVLRVRQ